MERRSAPVGSVAEAYPAGKPRSSAHLHGFTDASFQPAHHPQAEGLLDATSAATLAAWAAKVAPTSLSHFVASLYNTALLLPFSSFPCIPATKLDRLHA